VGTSRRNGRSGGETVCERVVECRASSLLVGRTALVSSSVIDFTAEDAVDWRGGAVGCSRAASGSWFCPVAKYAAADAPRPLFLGTTGWAMTNVATYRANLGVLLMTRVERPWFHPLSGWLYGKAVATGLLSFLGGGEGETHSPFESEDPDLYYLII